MTTVGNQSEISLAVPEEALEGGALADIVSPEMVSIFKTIKQIQKRMKDDDVKNLEYIRVYDKLSYEFDDFFNSYTSIFVKVLRGDDLTVVASVLYYRDQVNRGLITEAQLSDRLATRYLPKNLKAQSDAKLKEMANTKIQ